MSYSGLRPTDEAWEAMRRPVPAGTMLHNLTKCFTEYSVVVRRLDGSLERHTKSPWSSGVSLVEPDYRGPILDEAWLAGTIFDGRAEDLRMNRPETFPADEVATNPP